VIRDTSHRTKTDNCSDTRIVNRGNCVRKIRTVSHNKVFSQEMVGFSENCVIYMNRERRETMIYVSTIKRKWEVGKYPFIDDKRILVSDNWEKRGEFPTRM
jgi:hypothetical protein